jgi:hypothetical protein
MGDLAYQDVKTRYDQRDVSKRLGNAIKKLLGVEAEDSPDLTKTQLVLAR